MASKLTHDVDNAQIKRIFDILRTDTVLFDGCTTDEVDEVMNVLRVVSFNQGDCICSVGEPVDFFAFVAYGKLRVGKSKVLSAEQIRKGQKIHYVEIGEMIGHQNLAEQDGPFMASKWTFDLYGEQGGILAVLPFGELKTEMRKNPKPVCKLIELAANRAYETTYFNIEGAELNPVPPFLN